MPDVLHEVIVDLFRSCANVAVGIARDVFAVEVPAHTAVALGDSDFTQKMSTAYAADLVVLLEDGDEVVLGIVVEVQVHVDARKLYTWPLYAAALRAEKRCPVVVLVVTLDEAVASFARTEVEISPGRFWAPLVLGPRAVPIASADAPVELGVLSALAHGNEPGRTDMVASVLASLVSLDDERARVYYDQVWSSLSAAAKRELEKMAFGGKYEYQSDFAKKYYGQGIEAGLEKGREEGREAGREEGRQREARMLLAVLEHKGFELSDVRRARVEAASSAEIEQWVLRAVDAASIDEVFGDA